MHLAVLNMLAFVWHTMLEFLEPPWQAARQAVGKRTAFFAHLLMLTACAVFPKWEVFIQSRPNFSIPPELLNLSKS